MIISHKYKYIFLKTNKTAGTSIEIALSRFCGAEDVITPISPTDEALRRKLGGRMPQNYKNQAGDCLFFNHISAQEIKAIIGDAVWEDYFKFCFERNPWDRVLSLYYWVHQNEDRRPTLDEFIDSGSPYRLHERGYKLYTIDEEVVVDRLCLYERLDEELEEIGEMLGFPERLVLPRAKSGHRQDRSHYTSIINGANKEKIDQLLWKEMELLGYDF